MNFRATFIVSRTLHPSNIGLPEKNRDQESELASGNTDLDPVEQLLFPFSLFCLKNEADYPKGNDPLPTTNFQEQAYL